MAADSTPIGSTKPSKTAIEIHGDILKSLDSKLPKAIAAACGYPESSIVNKWRDGTCGVPLDKIGLFLHALDLKAVSIHSRCVDAGMLAALEALGSKALARGIVLEDAQ